MALRLASGDPAQPADLVESAVSLSSFPASSSGSARPLPLAAGFDATGWPLPRTSAIMPRSEEHTSELQSLMRISYAVFGFKKKKISHHRYQRRSNTSLPQS